MRLLRVLLSFPPEIRLIAPITSDPRALSFEPTQTTLRIDKEKCVDNLICFFSMAPQTLNNPPSKSVNI